MHVYADLTNRSIQIGHCPGTGRRSYAELLSVESHFWLLFSKDRTSSVSAFI